MCRARNNTDKPTFFCIQQTHAVFFAFLILLIYFILKITDDTCPIREICRTELYVTLTEVAGTMPRAVVDKVGIFLCGEQSFAVRDDHPLVEDIVKVLCYPCNLVTPCRRVAPGSGGKDVKVVAHVLQCTNSLCGSRHGIHQ